MSRLPLPLVAVLAGLLLAGPAGAQHFEVEEDDGPHPFVGWLADGANRGFVGLNGILTSPADPVMAAIKGNDTFEELPAPEYTGRFFGFLAGTCQTPYRILMGTFDFAFSWMPALYMQSPRPRVMIFPWAEHDN